MITTMMERDLPHHRDFPRLEVDDRAASLRRICPAVAMASWSVRGPFASRQICDQRLR
jgi:hypothetical protein